MASRSPLHFYDEPLPGVDASELRGKLIVVEGPDSVGRTTQVTKLRVWLEQEGHAVLDTGLAQSALTKKGIVAAKQTYTLGPRTMTLFYITDFADRLENEIIPALRAGFVVLTDRYIFSIMARAIARGESSSWLEKVAGIALVPHAVYYLHADVTDLVARVIQGQGAFDYRESGRDVPFGRDHCESFMKYQAQVIQALDGMADKYGFIPVDARRPPETVFRELQTSFSRLLGMSASKRPQVLVPQGDCNSSLGGPRDGRRVLSTSSTPTA